MQLIPIDCVRKWGKVSRGKFPSSISTLCPYCGERGVFGLLNCQDDTQRKTIAATAECPSCSNKVHFWVVFEDKAQVNCEDNPAAVYMYPPAHNYYSYPPLTPEVPEPLQRSLFSTIDAFNSRNFPATAVCGRRTLEGIFKYLVSEEKKNKKLYDMITCVTDEIDLGAPLTSLSHAIRDGGNLGAHFDEEKELDEASAHQIVELLDYLISYLYVLPGKIEKLEQSIAKST